MDETKNTQRKSAFWRWTLLVLAIAIVSVWLILTPEGLLGKADAVGYAVCHRISHRTFYIGDRPGPMCARCTGLFLGALLGMVYQIAQGRKGKMPPLPVMILFGILALSWVLDGVNSFSMLIPSLSSVYETQNWTRLVSGTGMGLAISVVLWPAFVQTVFTGWEDSSPLGSSVQVLGLLLAAGVMDGLILLQTPWILYPLSLLSALSVIMLLTIIYSMVWIMLCKKDNTYTHIKQLYFPLMGGFILAMLQVGAFDLARYLWTGTWDGFIL